MAPMIGVRIFRNRRALMALAVAFAFASPAFGTDAMSEAQKRFDEGKALYRKTHDAAGARLKFAQAYALHPRPEVLWNLAICELDVGFAEDAAGHLRAYARDPDAKPALVAKVPDLLQTARESLGGLRIEAPPRATVHVDGRQVERLEWQENVLDLTPGDRVLVVSIGSERVEDIVTIVRGTTVVRHIDDVPSPAPPSRANVDLHEPPLLAAAAQVDEVAAHEPSPSHLDTVAYTTAAFGLAALGTGVGFALLSQRDADSASDARARVGADDCRSSGSPACTSLNASLHDGTAHAWIAVGAYATSAALFGVSGWLFFKAHGNTPVAASLGPAGLALRISY